MSDCLICCDAKQEFSFSCCSYSICLGCKTKIEPRGKCPACRTWEEGKSEETNNDASWWYYEGLFDHFESETEDELETGNDSYVDSEEDPDYPYGRSYVAIREPRFNLLCPEHALRSESSWLSIPIDSGMESRRFRELEYDETRLLIRRNQEDSVTISPAALSYCRSYPTPPYRASNGKYTLAEVAAMMLLADDIGENLYKEFLDDLVEKASPDYIYNQAMRQIIRIAPELHEAVVKDKDLLQEKDIAKHEEQKARRRVAQRRLRISRLDRRISRLDRNPPSFRRLRNFRNAREPRQRGRGSRR